MNVSRRPRFHFKIGRVVNIIVIINIVINHNNNIIKMQGFQD